MSRKRNFKLLAMAVVLLIASACAKTIPEPEVAEPKAIKTQPVSEGSLWPGENSRNSLFMDNKATSVGDIITVHLVEETTASNGAYTATLRENDHAFSLSTDPTQDATEFSFGGGSEFTGEGSTSRSDRLISTISALVIEVLPNGTMRIDGRRKLRINNGDQYIHVKGLVRREDISYDNSVLSTKIANAEISYDGVGQLDRSQVSGWIGQTLDYIWPF
ncbi:MAG: flagellar basal body L-ring protein FlgH [Nitrospinota bacterium]